MYCNLNTSAMRVKKASAKLLLLSAICLLTGIAQAQNINNPNKKGPLGTQVNTLSGNFFLPRTDFYVPARVFNLDVSFYYNSYLFQEEYGYGKGWTFEYDIKYRPDTLPGGKIIMWGNGREDKYDSVPGGTYKAPRGFFNTLTQYQQGKYLLTETDGRKIYFDNPVHRKVTKMEEPNGNYISFSYTDTLLTSMTNGAGQTITLTYNQGRLASVVDAIATPARTFTYTYDAAGNLKEVKDPLNGKYKYEYLINGPLRSVTDKNNNKVDVIYYPDLAARELIGCNKRLSFSYDTATLATTVTEHLAEGNQVTRYTYKKLDNLSWITSISGNCCGFNVKYEYDEQGNMLKMTDANGKVYTYTYDANGNMMTATDPAGGKSSYTYSNFDKISSYKDAKGNQYTMSYDGDGNLTQLVAPGNNIYTATYNSMGDIISSTDPKGNVFAYNYDAYGNPATVTGPEGYSATLAYDARGNLLSFTDSRGYSSTAEYDILDRLKKITDPISNAERFSYDAQGNLVTYVNKNNETSLYSYDASNRLVHTADPTGNQSWLTYDNMDNITGIKNPLGFETKYTYDKRNRVSSAKDAEGNVVTYNYDANGNITSAVLTNGRVVNYVYDALNRIVQMKDDISTLAAFSYDANGNIISYTNATGAVTTAVYDSLNRIKQVNDPLGNSLSYVYDKNGNIISVTDEEGKTRHYTYDGRNRVKTSTNSNGFVITIGYDTEGNVTSLTDQNNNVTTYTYDSLNRRKRMTFPGGSYKEFTYDKKGNVSGVRLTDATIISFQYDTLNRMTGKTMPNGETHTYTYDKLGRILTATNSNGTVSFTYDALNRLASETFDGRTTQYVYNTSGRTQIVTYPDNSVVIKEFDTRNRLIRILKDSVLVAEYAYNNANQLTAKTSGNALNTVYQYDFANRLTNINTGSAVQNSTFTYDKAGNKKSIVRADDNWSEQFTYDNGYRLTSYKKGPSGSPLVQNSYNYDNAGNRTMANLNGVNAAYTVNNLNQLTSVDGTTLTYDGRGNLTYDGAFYKTYDAENRLIKDSLSPSAVIEYGYDAMNRVVTKKINGEIRKYSYGGVAAIEERDAMGNLVNSTVFADFLSPVLNEKEGNKFYFHTNEMGSVEGITNSNGRLIEKYSYDVYGKLSRFDSLNNPLTSSLAGNRFGFTGQEYDSATGSYRFYYRHYSPQTGLFNQRDLIEYKDGMAMYQYVANNPSNGIDIWGLEDCVTQKSEIDVMKYWDTFSDSKSYLEFVGIEVMDWLPRGVATPINIVTPYVDVYKTANSINAASNAKTTELQNMHAGDAIKNGTNATVGLVGIAGLAAGTAGAPVVAGAAAVGGTIFVVDKGSEAAFDVMVTDQYEYEALKSELEARENYINQGKTLEERRERAKKWELNQLRKERRKREWEERIKCPPPDGSNRPGNWVWDPNKKMYVLLPVDPNLIIGPDGKDEKKWVSVKDRMPYTVLFENDSTATARARYVKITTPIEPKQDPATLELGNFGFNNQSFEVPKGLSTYYERLDVRDSTGVYVDVVAGYDVMKHEIFWEFRAIDPLTLMPPDDPLAGFLMLKDTANPAYGNGFVNFTMKPLASSQTLDTIGARAFITFDENEVIPTNIHTNTIDAVAPTSQVLSVHTDANRRTTLTWSGVDDANGIGVDYYTIYVSNDRINYSILIPQIKRTDTTLVLPPDSVYCFFVLATDRVGNTETLRPNVSTCYSIGTTLPVTWLYFNGTTQGKNNILTWATGSETNTKEFSLERSLNGNSFRAIAVLPAAGNSAGTTEYRYTDPNIDRLNSERMYYRVKQVDLDGRFTYSRVVLLTYRENNNQPSVIYPNPTKGIVNILVGDKNMIGTEATLLDVNGRILQRVKITAGNQSFDMSALVNGIYFIKLANKETLRVIKQ